ncbi:MAG: FtsW/RodA/SpoVE family cell cycle protein [Kiritimatiellae bacterium]|nr:FtsW/RodA/SpoVE family cell cycle protein [Kiritimatiellia bacterium]
MKRHLLDRLPFDLGRLRRMRLGILLCMAALMAIGVCFVYSANSIRDNLRLQSQYLAHAQLAVLGVLLNLALAYCDYRRILRLGWLFYAGTIGLLLAVPFMGTDMGMGARRWVFGIQPAEFAKLATIIVLAQVLGRPSARRDIWEFLLGGLIVALPAGLVMLQPDLGTALVFVFVLMAMLFAAGTAPRALLLIVLAGALSVGAVLGAIVIQERASAAATPAAVTAQAGAPAPAAPSGWRHTVLLRACGLATGFLDDYQRRRLLDYLYPESDPVNLGWNRRQSEIAVGSGGIWGKGFLKGDQNLLGYLPQKVSANDFIFSVLAEEKGFAGAILVLLLFAGIVFPGLAVAATCRDGSGRLLIAGIVALIFCHVFINVGMTVGLLPVKGLPLPFISYGRTFMLTATVALGLLQSVAVHRDRAAARIVE